MKELNYSYCFLSFNLKVWIIDWPVLSISSWFFNSISQYSSAALKYIWANVIDSQTIARHNVLQKLGLLLWRQLSYPSYRVNYSRFSMRLVLTGYVATNLFATKFRSENDKFRLLRRVNQTIITHLDDFLFWSGD